MEEELKSSPPKLKSDLNLTSEEESRDESPGSGVDSEFPELGAKYTVLEYIGDGGMGAVYKVKDNELDTIVAVKVLKSELVSDKAALKRFEQEAASLSKLNHPNLVTVYGSGQMDDGRPFIIMDHLEGKDLASILQEEEKLNLDRIIAITEQICDGLSHAHKNGIVHRDIKPSNIIITTGGSKEQVKILDFGIARIVESTMGNTTNLTQTGEVFGTPTYMSPEQCETGQIDKRSDIYSLGCVIYEMATGAPPFQGTNPIQVAVKHINDQPEKFPKILTDSVAMKSLESLVMGCLSKDPHDRYKSTDELKKDFKELSQGKRINRFLVKNKDTRPKWIYYCCSFAIILSFYAIVTTTLLQIGEMQLISDYPPPIAVLTASMFIGINLFGMIMFPICARIDWKNLKAVDTKISHFWLLAESTSLTFILWLGAILYAIPNYVDTGYGLTGLISAFLGFIFVAVTIASIVIAVLASVYDVKPFKKFNRPLAKSYLVKQWFASLAAFLVITMPMFAIFPKPMSYVPLAFGLMVSSPAPILAQKFIDMALVLNPNNSTAVTQKAYLTLKMGKEKDALAVVDQAIEKDPQYTNYVHLRARMLMYLNRDKEALEVLNLALEQNPENEIYLKDRAKLYIKQKDYNKAISDYSKLIVIDPKQGANYRIRSLLHAHNNEFKQALDDMKNALITSTRYNTQEDYLRMAIIYDLAGDKLKANQFYKRSLGQNKSKYSKTNLSPLGKAYANYQLGNKAEYEKQLSKISDQKDKKKNFKSRILLGIDLPTKW